MKTVIRGIGAIVSGDLQRPLLDGDTIVIDGGKISAGGRGLDGDADTVIDARGTTVIPGLIDSHCHPVFGDFTPRQRTLDFSESGLNGGGATVATKAYQNLRPAGVKVHAGAPILELGMVEEDFAEMAKAGVKLVGEIGLGSGEGGA